MFWTSSTTSSVSPTHLLTAGSQELATKDERMMHKHLGLLQTLARPRDENNILLL